MTEREAIYAFLVAFAVAALLTPLTSRLARAVGAVDRPKERGLGKGETPLLGGLAMLAAVLLAAALLLDFGPVVEDRFRGILSGASVIALVGALDDRFDLHAALKLAGQVLAAYIPVQAGVEVSNITLPLLGPQELGSAGGPLTVAGLVLVMNVVNLSDGIDGLAAGVCAISAITFTIIAFDLGTDPAGVLAAIVAGAALGFLVHNFHPASVFMGDCGSNLLGLLLGAVIVQGALKTNAVVALIVPLVVLAVPFLDTGFVVAKRIKYRRPVYRADSNHFHHRFHRMGFSQRRTVAYLYTWTALMAGIAVALRFVPYSESSGRLNPGWAAVMAGLFVVGFAASVYLVYVLEILKFRRVRAWQLRRSDPDTDEHAIEAAVARDIETGEFSTVK